MKKVLVGLLITITVFLFMGCFPESADEKQAAKTQTMMLEVERQVGMPNIVNFQQKNL